MIGKGQQERTFKVIHYGLLLLHFNDKREKANQTNAGTPSAFTVDYDK